MSHRDLEILFVLDTSQLFCFYSDLHPIHWSILAPHAEEEFYEWNRFLTLAITMKEKEEMKEEIKE